MKNKRKCIIVDIDDTLSKEPFYDDLPQDNDRNSWNEYHKTRNFYSIRLYKPIKPMIDLIQNYYNGCKDKPMVVFLTGRENLDLIRLNTFRFIKKNFKIFNSPKQYNNDYLLLMRPENDYRPSSIIKEEYLKNVILPYYTPILAFDDDINNAKMFIENGLVTLQVGYMKGAYYE